MQQEPRTLWDCGMIRTRYSLPLVPTPEIQAPSQPRFASFHGPKRKESQKRFLSPTPCPAFQNSSSRAQEGFDFCCSLCSSRDAPLRSGGRPLSAPCCNISRGRSPAPVASYTSMSTLVLRCGEPRIVRQLGRASRYTNELPGSSSGDPLLSPEIRLHPLLGTSGFASPFPPCRRLQLRPQSCCSRSLFSGSLLPGSDQHHDW